MKSAIILTAMAFVLTLASPVSAILSTPVILEGFVQKVDEDKIAVMEVKEDSARLVEFQILPETEFKEETGSLDDINAGDNVSVEYTIEDELNIALSIVKIEIAEE